MSKWQMHYQKYKEYYKEYSQSKKGKVRRKKYDKTIKGQEIKKKADFKYCQSSKGKVASKKYQQSEKGRIIFAKMQARRKRDLGWILMFPNPFADSTLVDYHHITDTYVVAVPKDLHQLYLDKYHREKMMSIVKQIYLEVL